MKDPDVNSVLQTMERLPLKDLDGWSCVVTEFVWDRCVHNRYPETRRERGRIIRVLSKAISVIHGNSEAGQLHTYGFSSGVSDMSPDGEPLYVAGAYVGVSRSGGVVSLTLALRLLRRRRK